MQRAAALALLAATACASVPMAPADQDAAAKEFRATPGRTNLYVFRDESFGGAVKLTLILDGRILGDTGPKTFHLVTVEPGRHLLVSKAETDHPLEFTAEPGQNVYVWQEVKMGLWTARSLLQLVPEAQARPRVQECSRAVSEYAPAPAPEVPRS